MTSSSPTSGIPDTRPARDDAGVYTEALSTFRKEDEERFWLLDFHYPRGMVPLGYVFPEDGICFCTQQAAEGLPLPTSGGLARPDGRAAHLHQRGAGHLALGYRRAGRAGPAGPARHPRPVRADLGRPGRELNRGLAYFEGQSYDGRDLADLARLYEEAVIFHRRAWTIHFEIMYPLLATYVGFHGTCLELGIDAAEIAKFLQGYDSKIMETDRALWELTRKARAAGLGCRLRQHRRDRPGIDAARRPGGGRAGWPSSTRSCRRTGTAPRASPTSC